MYESDIVKLVLTRQYNRVLVLFVNHSYVEKKSYAMKLALDWTWQFIVQGPMNQSSKLILIVEKLTLESIKNFYI